MPRDVLLVEEMIQAAEQATALVRGMSAAEVTADRMRRDALLWNVTVLGEAAAQLSEELRARFPEVSWRQPTRLRNRLIHGYWSIDLDIVCTTAERQLPSFVGDLRRVLAAVTSEAASNGEEDPES